MTKRLLVALAAIVCAVAGLRAQCTSEPALLQEDSQNVVIYYHADQGNKVLAGQPASADLYAHTGVLTASSSSDSDWKYAPTWGDNSQKYKLEYVQPNLWKLNIGDIRTFYGITNPAETIKKLAFVFRNADCSKEGKAAGGGDIFVDVLASGLQVALETNLEGTVITPDNANVTFRLGATQPADLRITINGNLIAEAAQATELVTEYTFTEPGNYTVYGSGRGADGKLKETKLALCYTKASDELAYPGGKPQMGATRLDNGDVLFCVAAPGKHGVVLVGSWEDYQIDMDNTMHYMDIDGFRYFWTTVSGLKENEPYMYYYLVDSTISIGDPYARLILDFDNDKYISDAVYPNLPQYPSDKVKNVCLAVFQDNINDYNWEVTDFKPAAKDNLIVYELLLRDFTGTEGQARGNGTVRKAIEKLPYLIDLGVNVIELLPINEFQGNNSWGYNPNFYFAPDKAYGTPSDYKEFIDLCHKNGIAVVLDMVFNQADWQHPWYRLYQVNENPFFNATAPHAYSVLNDWNQGYPLVRQQWKDVVKYWMEEYKVDGYRFDLVKGLGDNDSYANNGDSGTNAYNASRVANMRDIQLAMLEVNPNCIFINENLAGAKEENEMGAFGMLNWANKNGAALQYAAGNSSGANLNGLYAKYDGRTLGTTVSYLESHDEQRLAWQQDNYGAEGVKGNVEVSMQRLGSAAAQMILSPGAHMIWQFSELGDYDSTKDNNGGNNTSPKPVRWNLLDEPARRGLYDNYSEMIGIRNNHPEMFAEDATFTMVCSTWATGRRLISKKGNSEMYCLINPAITGTLTMDIDFATKDNSAYYIMSQSYGANATFDAVNGKVNIPANCYVVIGTNDLKESGVEGIAADTDRLQVYSAEGRLTVAGAEGEVSVYNVAGVRVAVLADGESAQLPAGVYVAVCGRESRKVTVR